MCPPGTTSVPLRGRPAPELESQLIVIYGDATVTGSGIVFARNNGPKRLQERPRGDHDARFQFDCRLVRRRVPDGERSQCPARQSGRPAERLPPGADTLGAAFRAEGDSEGHAARHSAGNAAGTGALDTEVDAPSLGPIHSPENDSERAAREPRTLVPLFARAAVGPHATDDRPSSPEAAGRRTTRLDARVLDPGARTQHAAQQRAAFIDTTREPTQHLARRQPVDSALFDAGGHSAQPGDPHQPRSLDREDTRECRPPLQRSARGRRHGSAALQQPHRPAVALEGDQERHPPRPLPPGWHDHEPGRQPQAGHQQPGGGSVSHAPAAARRRRRPQGCNAQLGSDGGTQR